MFKLLDRRFYVGEDLGGGLGPLGKEDVINLLAEDDDEKDDKNKDDKDEKEDEEEIEVVDDKEDEDDEKDEIEIDDDEEVDPEKLELMTPVTRKEILKKYPNFFKEFPYVEAAYYRDKQFTEIYPTIDDAKTASEKASTLDQFEEDLLKGDTVKILSTVKELDVNAFHKIVDDYLPNLAKVDREAYNHVIGNLIKNTVVGMVKESRASKNDALQAAATLLHQFVFGTAEWKDATNLAKPVVKDEIAEERQKFTQQRFEVSRQEVTHRVSNALKSTIDQNIDPKNSMEAYIKKNASRDAMENLASIMNSDKGFSKILDRAWEDAFRQNFSPQSIDKIRSITLSKAKSLLPSVIKKARNEALGGKGRRLKDKETVDETENRPTVRRNKGESTAPTRGGKSDSDRAKEIPRGTSSLDYLMKD